MKPSLFAVVGATGTGKSAFALDLAEALAARGEPAEIVGTDAMQLYRGMDIGTAKLPVADRRGIPHHMLDVLDPDEDAAVAWYQHEARAAVLDIQGRGKHAILAGGSGLYVSSVLFDFQFPPRDEALRARLEAELAEHGPGFLFQRIRELDPATAQRIDAQNPRRLVRALEVLEQGERTHRAVLPEAPVSWQPARVFATAIPRAELVVRLDERVQGMWADGMISEVETLQENGLERGTTAPRAIGYAQALAQLRGELTAAEAIAQTQALTRRYARRQVSWFRRYADVTWLDVRETSAQDVLAASGGDSQFA